MFKQVAYTTIRQNRNAPRLWIEGLKLDTAGFKRGSHYSISIKEDSIIISLDQNGNRTTSGRNRNGRQIPIIDLNIKELSKQFGLDTRVRVIFTSGKIFITKHHEDAAKERRETRLRNNYNNGTLIEASLFTGGGISTHAIHTAIDDAGLKSSLAWIVDAELKYLQVGYKNNFAITDDTSAFIGKIEEIETSYYSEIDILSFSMPCTGFSIAGKSKHKKTPETHESSTALFGTINAIRAANPAILISENVREAQNSTAYTLLKAELIRLGYQIHERNMDQKDTGSIENRRRYWFVALSNGIASDFDFSLIHPDAEKSRPSLKEIFDIDIPENMWAENEYLKEKQKRDAAAGKGFANRQLLSGDETTVGTINRTYHKKQSTAPYITRSDGKERLLTPFEHARVKSVPEKLISDTSSTLAHEILGQSVDWRQAWIATTSILNHLSKIFSSSLSSSPMKDTSRPHAAIKKISINHYKETPSTQLSFDALLV